MKPYDPFFLMEIRVVHAFIYLFQAILEQIKLWEKDLSFKKREGGIQNFILLSHKVGELLAEV